MKITVETQEMDPEHMAQVFNIRGKAGWMMFKEQPSQITDDEIPDIKLEVGERPPSARMRGVLFAIWEQGGKSEPFEIFYRRRMEQLITILKEKLS